MDGSLLKIENLVTGYRQGKRNEIILHRSLNLELFPGELICMLGPNGAGKSTLLRTIIGFEKSFCGKIYFSGVQSDHINIKEIARLVSVVLTDKIDDAYLSAYEVISSGRYPYGNFLGQLTVQDKIIVEVAIKLIGVEKYTKNYFHQLSDGEKQKVMIARAIAQDTPLIFLDEPIAYVDSPSKVAIMNIIRTLSTKHKKGVLLATHDLDAALKFADRIWLIGKNGMNVLDKPQNLVDKGKINLFFDQDDVVFNKKNLRFESKI